MDNQSQRRGIQPDSAESGIYMPNILPPIVRDCMEEDLHKGLGLHLASGNRYWPGWLNIDYDPHYLVDIRADVTNLPIKDKCIDVVCAIHMVEHVYPWLAKNLLLEWKRVLKPGGKLIIELPCMDKIYAYIVKCHLDKKPMYAAFTSWAFWGDPRKQDVGMMHRWGYSYYDINELLEQVGFQEIAFAAPKYHIPQRDMRIEAIKP